jgi:hypothetical protein
MTKNNKTSNKYWAEIEINNGVTRIVKANKLQPLNQYKSKWIPTNARNLARGINNSQILVK